MRIKKSPLTFSCVKNLILVRSLENNFLLSNYMYIQTQDICEPVYRRKKISFIRKRKMNTLLLWSGVILSTAVSYVLACKWKNKRLYKMLEAFPSPPTLPFIGNVHMIFGNVSGKPKLFLLSFVFLMLLPLLLCCLSFLKNFLRY